MTGIAVLGNYTTPQVVLHGAKPKDWNHKRALMISQQCFTFSSILRCYLIQNIRKRMDSSHFTGDIVLGMTPVSESESCKCVLSHTFFN